MSNFIFYPLIFYFIFIPLFDKSVTLKNKFGFDFLLIASQGISNNCWCFFNCLKKIYNLLFNCSIYIHSYIAKAAHFLFYGCSDNHRMHFFAQVMYKKKTT